METTVHTYRFIIDDDGEAEKYQEFRRQMEARPGPRCFEVLSRARDEHKMEDGGTLTLETKHLFSNQWNTECGLRVFDWYQAIYPNENVKSGYWLEQTDEMREVRRNTLACGYCGVNRPAAQGLTFCPDCLDSEYLKQSELHLTRLKPCGLFMPKREPLDDAEAARLFPLYVEAQTKGTHSRAVAARARERERIDSAYAAAIENAEIEHTGITWLLDHHMNTGNVIYYKHTQRFSFGWRTPLTPGVASTLRDLLSEFPCDYDLKEEGK